MIPRRTLARPATLAGPGLFTGKHAELTIEPADAGIQLRLDDADPFHAHAARLDDRKPHPAFALLPGRSTNLAASPAATAVFTCEHLLSALAGLGITDALCTLSPAAPEPPIGDGDDAHFTAAILDAGIADLQRTIEPITLAEPITVTSPDGRATITAEPAGAPDYAYHLEYPPPAAIPPQHARWRGDHRDYADNIAPARTFSLEREARQMAALGLFKDLDDDRFLVFADDGSGPTAGNTLRFDNEPARHKLLDLIGDLALAGRPVHARITAARSGHALNHQMARRLANLA